MTLSKENMIVTQRIYKRKQQQEKQKNKQTKPQVNRLEE